MKQRFRIYEEIRELKIGEWEKNWEWRINDKWIGDG